MSLTRSDVLFVPPPGASHIPDGFIERSTPEFAVAFGMTTARFWHMHRLNRTENLDGLYLRGCFGAMRWMCNHQPDPPGSGIARLRTRYDLYDLLRLTELCCDDPLGRWESETAHLAQGLFFVDRREAQGARLAYLWALRIRNERPFGPLHPDDYEKAMAHYHALCEQFEKTSAKTRAA